MTDEPKLALRTQDGSTIPVSEHKTLAEALLGAQQQMPAVEPDQENPHFRSKFVSLGHLLSKVRPVLNANGIVVVQKPTLNEEGQFVLRTRLIHAATGEAEESDAPLSGSNPQQHGSSITYMKRYSLAAALAIADQADDDALASSQPEQPARAGLEPVRVESLMAELSKRRKAGMKPTDLDLLLGSIGVDSPDAHTVAGVRRRIESMSVEQADALETELAKEAE